MRPRPIAWLTGLSPRRRVFVAGVTALVVVLAGLGGSRLAGPGQAAVSPAGPGAVLLVPGYGGSTSALGVLAGRIRITGRTAIVVRPPGNGTGDLAGQASALNDAVNKALGNGSGPVTVVGYSAGGVVAWLWDVSYHATAKVRRFITLGSPLHGAQLAALGEAFVPGECPVACQQLAPGSSLLTALARAPAAERPPWLSLWTTGDQIVKPPDSARLDGAVNVPLQSVCPGVLVSHEQLPSTPLVIGIVLRALSHTPRTAPTRSQCQPLQTLGGQ